MPKKSLAQKLSDRADTLGISNMAPQLVHHYQNAHRRIIGIEPYVHHKHFSAFQVFADDLRDMNIPTKQYAEVVIDALKGLIFKKGMSSIPINMFLSDYGIHQYKKISNVRSDIDYGQLLYYELILARVYIDRNVNGYDMSFDDVVKEFSVLLSEHWKYAYRTNQRPVEDVVNILCVEFHVTLCDSYDDIIKALA